MHSAVAPFSPQSVGLSEDWCLAGDILLVLLRLLSRRLVLQDIVCLNQP